MAVGEPSTESSEVLPWDSIQFFLTLARKGTLARAARRLGVSHTTVLRRVARLERELDAKLFDRSAAGFGLTDAGRALLRHAEGMERLADEIFSMGETPGQLAGPVRVASLEGLATRVLTPLLAVFAEQYPQIEVELVTMTHPANLNLREVDIAIGPTEHAGPRVTSRRIATCGIRLYAAKSYLDRHGTPVAVEQLDTHRFVDYVEDLVEFPELRWLRETIGKRTVVCRSTSPNVQVEAVRHGLGLGMFPHYMVAHETEIVPVMNDVLSVDRDYWIAMHQNLWLVPRMEAVARFLNQSVPQLIAQTP